MLIIWDLQIWSTIFFTISLCFGVIIIMYLTCIPCCISARKMYVTHINRKITDIMTWTQNHVKSEQILVCDTKIPYTWRELSSSLLFIRYFVFWTMKYLANNRFKDFSSGEITEINWMLQINPNFSHRIQSRNLYSNLVFSRYRSLQKEKEKDCNSSSSSFFSWENNQKLNNIVERPKSNYRHLMQVW